MPTKSERLGFRVHAVGTDPPRAGPTAPRLRPRRSREWSGRRDDSRHPLHFGTYTDKDTGQTRDIVADNVGASLKFVSVDLRPHTSRPRNGQIRNGAGSSTGLVRRHLSASADLNQQGRGESQRTLAPHTCSIPSQLSDATHFVTAGGRCPAGFSGTVSRSTWRRLRWPQPAAGHDDHRREHQRHHHDDRGARGHPSPARRQGQARTRPDRVLADKGYPSKANRAWLRVRRIAATIPERDDQIAHRRRKPGRPIDLGDEQQERYKGRNVVERCFNRLKQWRGIAMRSDKLVRSYRAAVGLAATLI